MNESTPKSISRPAIIAIAACAIFLAIYAGLSWAAINRKCATYDEPLHLVSAWMAAHDADLSCDPEDPPLWKYYAVAGTNSAKMKIDVHSAAAQTMRQDPYEECDFTTPTFYQSANDPDALLRRARARMLDLSILLGLLTVAWAWKLAGPFAATVAAALFCLDPNFMAHGPLMKNDITMTLAALFLVFAVWQLGKRISPLWCLAVCLALGISLATKFTGLLMIPLLAILLICRAMLPAPWPVFQFQLNRRGQRLLAAAGVMIASLLLSWAMIWACYDFRFNPTPDPREQLDMPRLAKMATVSEILLQQHDEQWPSMEERVLLGNSRPRSACVNAVLTLQRRHLLPQSWLGGLLFTYANSLVRLGFLCGRISHFGWWYYFPLAMLFKTPLATLAAIAAALVVAIAAAIARGIRQIRIRSDRLWTPLCLLIPPLFYMALAMRSHINLGLRHVLVVYPFIFIAVGIAARAAWTRAPRSTALICGALLILLAAENFCAFPDYIPFFNAAAGGSRGGAALLTDSNLDWGQDLPALVRWQRDNPQTQIALCYFGSADPRIYGLHYVSIRGSQAPPSELAWKGNSAILAISESFLSGVYLNQADRRYYHALLNGRQPLAVLGGSIYLFDIPVSQ